MAVTNKFSKANGYATPSAGVFRDWGQTFSNAFASVGLVPTTSLTLANGTATSWSTVNDPGTVALFCYEIWALPGVTSPASPIYIKVWYGRAGLSNGVTYYGLTLAVSPSTSFTPVVSQNLTCYTLQVGGTDNYISCDGHGLGLVVGVVPGAVSRNLCGLFVVDRHRAINGTVLNTGVAAYGSLTATALAQSHLDLVANKVYSSIGGDFDTVGAVTDGVLSSSEQKTDSTGRTQVHPWWSITPNSRGISKMIGTYNSANFQPQFNTIDVDFCGEISERYQACGRVISTSSSFSESYGFMIGDDSSDSAAVAIWWGLN